MTCDLFISSAGKKNMKLIVACIFCAHAIPLFCAAQKVTCKETDDFLLTCGLVPAGPVPTVYDDYGVYPYVSYVETANRPLLKSYHFITIENDNLKVTICPDLGGKLVSMIHKHSGREVLYQPGIVRPVRILPRFYFTAGGIEVSFPISHSPSQNEKLGYKIDSAGQRIYVTCGERELRFGMEYSIEYSLGVGDNFLTERVVYSNPGAQAYPWMSWSNAALPSAPDTKYYFPNGRVLRHAAKVDTINWKTDGPKSEADIKEMTGYFWQTKDVNAFGVYTPSFGSGLYHIADEKISPGVKLWSYGRGEDSNWAVLSTAKDQTYIEIQSGPLSDQSIKTELNPGESKWHAEYWIPSDIALNIYRIKLPQPILRPVAAIPKFSWASPAGVQVWLDLMKAEEQKAKLPVAPSIDEMLWPPSGIENMDAAFQYAIATDESKSDGWKFYYGTWLAGRTRKKEAIRLFSQCQGGLAKVLLARLLKLEGDTSGALSAIELVNEPWLQLHPQIVVERDKLLRSAGTKTIPEREKWIAAVGALRDEWILERKVQLLIDEGRIENAKALLLSVPWQKVHQTYTRTGLWRQICEKQGLNYQPVPPQLGEDHLARFGAYREYE